MKTTPTLNGQELELFRVGNYGDKGNYTAADMEGIVARYSSVGETPFTMGHPETDAAPAYAWFKSVRFAGDTLYGVPGDVDPTFDQLHSEKRYKNRSVAFAKDKKTGELYLHHVAALGAVPPVVKGLKPAQFSSDPYEVFAFSEGDDMEDEKIKKGIAEGIAAFFSEKFGAKQAAAPVDAAALTASVTAAVEAKFADALKAEQTARGAIETEFAAHKKLFADGGNASRVDQVIGELKTAGAWVPAYDRPEVGVRSLFSELAAQEQVITFSDKDGKEVKRDLVTVFADVLKTVGAIVPKGQTFSATTVATETAKPAQAANGDVDPNSVTFSEMVSARSTEKNIPYTEAYSQLVAEGKRPKAGEAAAGAV